MEYTHTLHSQQRRTVEDANLWVQLYRERTRETLLMHFWIDKRSQACGFNGRHGVPASLLSGRRRNKPIGVPIHRFQSVENGTIQQIRRPHVTSHARQISQQTCLAPIISNQTDNNTIMSTGHQPIEVDSSIFIETSAHRILENGQQSRLMRLGGLIKYGIWASFGLITVSVAVTKSLINHQGTFEMLLLCTLGMLSIGLLGSCILSVCRTKTTQELITAPPHPHDREIQAVMSNLEETLLPAEMPANASNQIIIGTNLNAATESEQSPPPYHIAILLPSKERNYPEFPPPSYENAMR